MRWQIDVEFTVGCDITFKDNNYHHNRVGEMRGQRLLLTNKKVNIYIRLMQHDYNRCLRYFQAIVVQKIKNGRSFIGFKVSAWILQVLP